LFERLLLFELFVLGLVRRVLLAVRLGIFLVLWRLLLLLFLLFLFVLIAFLAFLILLLATFFLLVRFAF